MIFVVVKVKFVARNVADNARLIAFDHICDARNQVAKIVAEFVVVGFFEFFPSKIAVIQSRNVSREVISKSVEAVIIDNFVRIDNIADRFAHFHSARRNVAVNEKLFRQRQTEPEQHRRPNSSVKSQNVFSDNLNICWPKFNPFIVAIWITDHAQVIRQSVNPNIHHLRRLARNRHAPV